jgi:protein-S-isoprenylcysteine O-methyltransferase Ste14
MKLYRFANRSSTTWIAAKTVASIVVVWSLALWVLPIVVDRLAAAWLPSWVSFAPKKVVSALAFLTGSFTGLSAASTMVRHGRGTPLPFDAASELVSTGTYAYVRNPMAVSAILQSLGVGLWFGSWAVLAYSVGAGVVWHFLIRPSEEAFLHEKFGTVYLDYRNRVGLWVPRVPRGRTGSR